MSEDFNNSYFSIKSSMQALSRLFTLSPLLGTLVLMGYWYETRYLPNFDIASLSGVLLAAAVTAGLILSIFILLMFLPAVVWIWSLHGNAIIRRHVIYGDRKKLVKTFFNWYMTLPVVTGVFIVLGMLFGPGWALIMSFAFTIFGIWALYYKNKKRGERFSGFLTGAVLSAFANIWVLFGLGELLKLFPPPDGTATTMLFIINGALVLLFNFIVCLVYFHQRKSQKIPISIKVSVVFGIIFSAQSGLLSNLSGIIMEKYSLGNFKTQRVVLDAKYCEIFVELHKLQDCEDSKLLTLERVNIISKIGTELVVEYNDERLLIPQSQVFLIEPSI